MNGDVDERFSLAETGLSCAVPPSEVLTWPVSRSATWMRGQEVQHHAGHDRHEETRRDERSPRDPLTAGLQGCAPPAYLAAA